MVKRQVFYSFHFGNDVMRVQQIRNIDVLEGNTPSTANEWESIKKNGNNRKAALFLTDKQIPVYEGDIVKAH
jgi:hypothetical protein